MNHMRLRALSGTWHVPALAIPLAVAISLLAIAVLSATVSSGRAAFAAGLGEHASCMGHEAAAISPPGSSDEIPGGAPGLKEFIDSLGVTPGSVYSGIARLHEGSHEACDAVLD